MLIVVESGKSKIILARKRTGIVYKKLDKKNFVSSNKIPNYKYTPRPDPSRNVPSIPMTFSPAEKDSMMERALRSKEESEETRAEIIRKSKCLAPAYNKGAVQYIGTEEEAKDVGK